MPLNLTANNDGDFTPYLKYNAKAGRFYVRPQGATADVEVVNPRLAIDMHNIKTGWIFYAEGSGPEKVWDPSPTQMAPRPAGPRKFKRGFEVVAFGADDIRGVGKLGLREFSSTASNVITAILKMYAAYEEGSLKNAGKVPFYRCTGVNPINGAFGTNYEPEFELFSWIDRAKIPELDEHIEKRGDTTAPVGVTSNGHDQHHATGNGVPTGYQTRGQNDLDDEIPF